MKLNNSQRTSILRSRRRKGSTLLEFALIVPILLLMILGIMEFGWMTKNRLQLANAVREGARDSAIGRSTDNVKNRIEQRAAGIPGVPSQLTVTQRYDSTDNNSVNFDSMVGNQPADSEGNIYNNVPPRLLIQITASVPKTTLTGLRFGGNSTIEVSVVMRRERNG